MILQAEDRNPMRLPDGSHPPAFSGASPGAARNGRWREIRRSEFVTVPLFSPQPIEGSSSGVASAAASTPTCQPSPT